MKTLTKGKLESKTLTGTCHRCGAKVECDASEAKPVRELHKIKVKSEKEDEPDTVVEKDVCSSWVHCPTPKCGCIIRVR